MKKWFMRSFIPKWNRWISDTRCLIAWVLFSLGAKITDASCHSRHGEWTWKKETLKKS